MFFQYSITPILPLKYNASSSSKGMGMLIILPTVALCLAPLIIGQISYLLTPFFLVDKIKQNRTDDK